jgi:hypothetical protein
MNHHHPAKGKILQASTADAMASFLPTMPPPVPSPRRDELLPGLWSGLTAIVSSRHMLRGCAALDQFSCLDPLQM